MSVIYPNGRLLVASARSIQSELYGSYNSEATVKVTFQGITTSSTLNT
jgi:hypothetical protein